MIFQQHYLDCLSQASYLIGDERTGRAVVIDPRRDVGMYLDEAAEYGLTIELVIETHLHADFLSGHLELAAAGATIAYGDRADLDFEARGLAHGEVIELGDVRLEIRHTPGHTPESISIVVWEHPDAETPYGVCTGDTLFIGDVGRPDLLSSVGVTADELARQLHTSLHEQLLSLPDETRVFPGHGAGSACGKNLSTDTVSTIGEQRRTNHALQPMTVEAFVESVTTGQTAPPAYFAFDADQNRRVRPLLDESAPPLTLTLEGALAHQSDGAVVLDTRAPDEFAEGHLPGAINVGLAGRYAEFVGGVIAVGVPIVLVTPEGAELEAKNRLARIGFDTVVGVVRDVPTNSLVASERVDVAELTAALDGEADIQLVDVRQPGETAGGVIEGAVTVPLTMLNQRLGELDPSRRTIVYCAGGFRSSIAASRLAGAGFGDLADLVGGYGAWTVAQAEVAS